MSSYNKITKTDLADGALYEKVNDMVDTLNADKIERGQVGIRKGSTAYKVGDKCFCEYHGDFLLECTTAGTSAVGQLDTSGTVTDGATRTDGSVVWTFRSVATKKELNDVKNSSLNKTQITNCITEIQQDIKLELNNGVLTLKAGSKVYVPNGAGKFDVKNITADKTYTTLDGKGIMITVLPNNELGKFTNTSSGTTQPTNPAGLNAWYDTTNNVIKRYISNAWESGCSFPIAIVTVSNGAISSIDQIFNGFGYIGSTAFVLPGVKGLIPNGRNTNGTLRNTAFTVDRVITRTITWNNSAGQELFIGKYDLNTGSTIQYISTGNLSQYYKQETEPSMERYTLWYKPSENKVYRCDLDSNSNLIWKDIFPCYIGQWFTSGSSPYPITELTTKTTFHAVDYNEVKSIVFPSQTGKAGKALLTDGENAYWGDTSGVIIRDWSS